MLPTRLGLKKVVASRKAVTLAAVALLVAASHLALAQLPQATDPAGSQTYFLDSATASGSCSSGFHSLDYQAVPSASSVGASSLTFQDADFCNPAAAAAVTTQDVTVVLYLGSTPSTNVELDAFLFDLNSGASNTPNAVASVSISGGGCSSPPG